MMAGIMVCRFCVQRHGQDGNVAAGGAEKMMIDQTGSRTPNFRSIPLHFKIALYAYGRLKFFQGISKPIYHRGPSHRFLILAEASPVAATANVL